MGYSGSYEIYITRVMTGQVSQKGHLIINWKPVLWLIDSIFVIIGFPIESNAVVDVAVFSENNKYRVTVLIKTKVTCYNWCFDILRKVE